MPYNPELRKRTIQRRKAVKRMAEYWKDFGHNYDKDMSGHREEILGMMMYEGKTAKQAFDVAAGRLADANKLQRDLQQHITPEMMEILNSLV
ncbi:hypothetical protein GR11A_00191 [Vibrio phage vB_VcorM_GR11A]|nr:hypothetical protein GR11A_00191 [Vibrio phage vB_VcorM_GR11A]